MAHTHLGGIKVIKIFENWTSQTCRKCEQRGSRRTQGLFVCNTCGEENADRNASFNIAYRALGYISKVGLTRKDSCSRIHFSPATGYGT